MTPNNIPEKANKRARLKYEASKLAKVTRKLYRQSPKGREAARRASKAYRDRQRAALIHGQAQPKCKILDDGTIQAL